MTTGPARTPDRTGPPVGHASGRGADHDGDRGRTEVDVRDPAATVDPHGPPPTAPWRGALELAASIITPLSLITAALYYFGWVRSNAIARFFGYDVELLNLTTQDYLLRSVVPMFVPIVVGLIGLILLSVLARWLRGRVGAGAVGAHTARRGGAVLMTLGAVAIVAGALATPGQRSDVLYAVGALLLGGAVAAGLGIVVWQAAGTTGSVPSTSPPLAVLVGLIAIGLVGVFTGVTRYADEIGVGRARQTLAGLDRLGDVILYSDRNLHISGGGTDCAVLSDDEGAFRYRYGGLRLFTQAGDRILLLPAQYGRNGVAEVIVVTLGDGVRMDLSTARLLGGEPPPVPAGARPCRPAPG